MLFLAKQVLRLLGTVARKSSVGGLYVCAGGVEILNFLKITDL